jgi:hypothetical protein
MNPALAGVALAVTIGAIVAVSTRDARAAVLGLAVALVGAPILADPMADTAALAGRVVASVLATYLLWIAVRDGEWGTGGSRLGWASDASVAAAAAIAGYGTHGLGAPALGPPLAQAAGFALAALAVAPLVTGRDVVRIGIGLLLLTQGALLVRVALGGTPSALEQLVTAGLVVGLGGAVAVLANAARHDGADGFELEPEGRRVPRFLPRRLPARSVGRPDEPARRAPYAHPLDDRP